MAFVFGSLIMGWASYFQPEFLMTSNDLLWFWVSPISLHKAFAFVVGYLPSGVLQAAMSINGMVMGPSLGVFSLGAFFPWVNSTGAIVGYLCGLGSAIWLYVGSQICPPGPEWTNELSYSTDMCNGTAPVLPPKESSCDTSLEPFYNLSYMYIST